MPFLGLWRETKSVIDITESCCFLGCGVIGSSRSVPAFHLFRLHTFILCYVLYFNIIQIVTLKKGPLRLLLYRPLFGCSIDMPEDVLSTDRNMQHTYKCN